MSLPDESGADWSRTRKLPDDYFTTPSPARVWNYWMNGKDYYEPDKKVGDVVAKVYPGIRTMASQSRQFLLRTVRYLAGIGITQFLDLGAGLPDPLGNNTHTIAQTVAPSARILYIDNDPVVLAHARALLSRNTPDGVSACLAKDYGDTDGLIKLASETLDFSRPVSVMFMGVFGYLPSYTELRSIVDRTMARVPSGSYLTFWDGTSTSPEIRESHRLQADMGHPYTLRTIEEIAGVFAGLELVDPGVVQLGQWRPNKNEITAQSAQHVDAYGGVARKP